MKKEMFEAIDVAVEIIQNTITNEGGECFVVDDIIWSDNERGFSIGIFVDSYDPDSDEYGYFEVDRFFFDYDEGLTLTLLEQVKREAENWVEEWLRLEA